MTKHELVRFSACTWGDGGFYYHDNADRAVCSCGWISAASQDKLALVAMHTAHANRATDDYRTTMVYEPPLLLKEQND